MARPKVPEDKRQRTAQACDSCKRRKQKCNGLTPCDTCTKRNLTCAYSPSTAPDNGPREPTGSPRKRRHIESPVTSSHPHESPPGSSSSTHLITQPVQIATAGSQPSSQVSCAITPPQDRGDNAQHFVPQFSVHEVAPPKSRDLSPPLVVHEPLQASYDDDYESHSRKSTVSGPDEEAPVFQSTRMLQDSTGRLLYLGDSATLSYLQLIRMIVEETVGPSPFTKDPSRHRIMENTVSLPTNVRPPHLFLPPARETAVVLVNSFFTNTMGLIEVFDRNEFQRSMDVCYSDPLHVDPSFLCLLYLVFAIGLVLAVPIPGTREDQIIKRLRSDDLEWAERFYRSAKLLGDPVSGFEDADFWSIQALLLMSVYMLSISKRNAAYAYYGMAVRSAFALGLHREEASISAIFGQENSTVRRNLWRTLFVLDRFLSASLGRPTAISEGDCSPDALKSPPKREGEEETSLDSIHSGGLDAAVRSSQVIGIILKKVYSRRKISTGLAHEIAGMCKSWPRTLHPSLHWRQAATGATAPAHGIAILHTNLFCCHTMILLTRPFFLFMFTGLQQARNQGSVASPRTVSRMEKFSQACVVASYHTIYLVQKAYMDNYLPQRNPFVLYFLFAASLIVLTNEFGKLYHDDAYESCITNVVSLMGYCAETDPQAARCLYIVNTFRDVVAQKAKSATDVAPTISSTPTSTYDPMANFLGSHDHQTYNKSSPPEIRVRNASIVPNWSRNHTLASRSASHLPAQAEASSQSSAMDNKSPGMALDSVTPPSNTVLSQPADYQPGLALSDVSGSLPDAEFDFETLWNWQAPSATTPTMVPASAAPMPTPAPNLHLFRPSLLPEYPHFPAMAPQGPQGDGSTGLGGGVPVYPNFL